MGAGYSILVRRSSAGDAASDAVAIAGRPRMDERLVEACQPVGPGTERVGVNTYPY